MVAHGRNHSRSASTCGIPAQPLKCTVNQCSRLAPRVGRSQRRTSIQPTSAPRLTRANTLLPGLTTIRTVNKLRLPATLSPHAPACRFARHPLNPALGGLSGSIGQPADLTDCPINFPQLHPTSCRERTPLPIHAAESPHLLSTPKIDRHDRREYSQIRLTRDNEVLPTTHTS